MANTPNGSFSFCYSRFEVIGIGDIDGIVDEQELNKTTGTPTK